MGLSIHYSGSFNKDASLSEMIEEVKDIAKIYKWKYTIYEKQFSKSNLDKISYNQDIYGISFTPTNCETVFLSFLSNGKMSSAPNLNFFGKSDDEADRKYLYMLSTKTQYAGVEVHKLVIHLFQYLSKKYFQYFKLSDEGQYWETGDELELRKIFNRYTELLQNFATAFEIIPLNSGESLENYFKRIVKQIHDRNINKDDS